MLCYVEPEGEKQRLLQQLLWERSTVVHMATGPQDDDSFPPLRKPSQLYVDNYIARSSTTPASRTAALAPRQGPCQRRVGVDDPE